jgi:hypothetical protein
MENVNVLQENTIVQLQLRANRAIKIVSLAQVLPAHLVYPAIPPQESSSIQPAKLAIRAIKLVSLAQVLAHLAYPAIPLLKESWK